MDVFSFTAVAGTEVWFDADSTSTILDTVIELIDADGVLVARSVNSLTEQSDPSQILVTPAIGTGTVNPVAKTSPEYVARHESGLPKDFFSQNVHDAGFRITLPGVVGTRTTYHLRLRSNSDNLDNLAGGLTEGAYRLQVRMREIDEVPGTTIRNADIRYATNGVELFGLPGHSPLTGEVQEDEASTVDFTEGTTTIRENNNALPTLALVPPVPLHRGRIWPATTVPGNGPQDIGNLLATDRATLSIGGSLSDS